VNEQPSIYAIAAETPSATLASRLRVTIAKVATSDPEWCRTYDNLIEATSAGGLRHPEMHVFKQRALWTGPVYLADASVSVRDAAETLLMQAERLGADDTAASDLDLVSAVVAAEVWLAVGDADNLAYAAAKGPDAIASAGAILARACGQGVALMPFDPDWPSLRFPLDHLPAVVGLARAWSDCVLGVHAWGEITARVVTDLAYHAAGGTKTHDASLFLGLRMLDIPPTDR
jgi:hypothetical protein